MKKIVFACLIVGLTLACGKSDVAGPTTQPVVVKAPEQVTLTPTVVAPTTTVPAPKGNPQGKGAIVNFDGSVKAGAELGDVTACVYTYKDFATQTFSHSFPVAGKGATTPFKAGDWACGQTLVVQVDVQRGTVCPADPFADKWDGGYIAGQKDIQVITPACPTCSPKTIWTVTNNRTNDETPYQIYIQTTTPFSFEHTLTSLWLSGGQQASFDGPSDTTLFAYFEVPHITYLYDYDPIVGGSLGAAVKNDCESEGGTYYGSKDGRSNVCATPVNHGVVWMYDPLLFATKYKTETVNNPSYDKATSHHSDACPVNTLTAKWSGDASLTSECVCEEARSVEPN